MGLPDHHVYLARQILDVCGRLDAIKDGDRVLDIGTGWVHWAGTIARLFYDVEVTLFDVWDNRSLESYQTYLRAFEQQMEGALDMPPVRFAHARDVIRTILSSSSFAEIYDRLNFTYVVNPAGTLEPFPDEAFELLLSVDVLEHVHHDLLPGFIVDFPRVLSPGGHSVHLIDMTDHFSHFDHSVHNKNYLRYSDRTWSMLFETRLQYFNRVQRQQWLSWFREAGLIELEHRSEYTELGSMKVSPAYHSIPRDDLACSHVLAVHRKPDASREHVHRQAYSVGSASGDGGSL